MAHHDIPGPTSPEVAALSTPDQRVDYIADLMRALRFERGRTYKALAEAWQVHRDTAKKYCAEASRIVRAEVTDREGIEIDVNQALNAALASAVAKVDRDPRAVALVAKTWAEISGVKAAERHEVTTTEATPEQARRIMAERFGKLTPQSDEARDGAADSQR